MPPAIVTVRIMEEIRNGELVIRVDGWLEGQEEAAELLRVAREATCPVVVDLKRLMSSDAHGIGTLLTLRREGARLHRASDFIKLLLETESPAQPASGRPNAIATRDTKVRRRRR